MYPPMSAALPASNGTCFLDLEFNSVGPTILGAASGGKYGSVPWVLGTSWLRAQIAEGTRFIGHAIISADAPIIERALGIKLDSDLRNFEDSMIWHYLLNAELCKGASEEDEEEEGVYADARGAGYMDLWTLASLYTELPNWKWPWNCSNPNACVGRPCPRHTPEWYNGLDVHSLQLAWPQLMADVKAKRLPLSLYQHVHAVTLLCEDMTRRGVLIDPVRLREIEQLMEDAKTKHFPSRLVPAYGKKGQLLKNPKLVWDAPFNPRSPKAMKDWFLNHGVSLHKTELKELRYALDRTDPEHEAYPWLKRAVEYKRVGKGAGPWFAGKYLTNNVLHPRFIPTASSLGRLASSGPNFQNIPSKGELMSRLREVIIPRPGYKIVTADSKQLELRRCLHAAGVATNYGGDAFNGLIAAAPMLFEEATRRINRMKWTSRDTAKSVTHGGDYGEGMVLLRPTMLEKARTREMIAAGALRVYRNWEYCGHVVAFNGVNLAERLFGSASWENRKKALEIQEALYTSKDSPAAPIREWQKRVSQSVELAGYHRLPTGRYLDLSCYPDPIDRLKLALAFEGQGGGAEYVQEMGLKYRGAEGPIAQVHDEWIFERPLSESKEKTLEFCQELAGESSRLPGFSCPVDVNESSNNWAECKK